VLVWIVVGAITEPSPAPAPRFKVGDCVAIDLHRERWEDVIITKIVEIGVRAYAQVFWLESRKAWALDSPRTLYFREQRMYRVVDCPR